MCSRITEERSSICARKRERTSWPTHGRKSRAFTSPSHSLLSSPSRSSSLLLSKHHTIQFFLHIAVVRKKLLRLINLPQRAWGVWSTSAESVEHRRLIMKFCLVHIRRFPLVPRHPVALFERLVRLHDKTSNQEAQLPIILYFPNIDV